MPSADVRHNSAQNRFEIYLEGTLAGFLEYAIEDETYALTHTEVLAQFGSTGVGSALIVGAMGQIRELGGEILPYCPFIPKVILDHPEFTDLVPAAARPQFGLE